jgi:xanthine/uracil permease
MKEHHKLLLPALFAAINVTPVFSDVMTTLFKTYAMKNVVTPSIKGIVKTVIRFDLAPKKRTLC